MSIKEKLKAEEGNVSSIVLYGDGSGWIHAYERSAYSFVRLVRKYKVQIKSSKERNDVYYQIGFRKDALKDCLKGFKYSEDHPDEKTRVYVIKTPKDDFSEEEYQSWRNVVMVESIREKGSKKSETAPAVPECPAVSPAASDSLDSSKASQVAPLKEDGLLAGGSDEAAFNKSIVEELDGIELSHYSPWMALQYLNDLKDRISKWKTITV